MRGQGRIFLRGSIQWIGYFLNGREFRESSGSTDEAVARKLLAKRLKEVGADQIGARKFTTPKSQRLTIHDLLEALRQDYELRSISSSQNQSSIARADKDFGDKRATNLTAEQIDIYIRGRLDAGDRPATVNRTLQHLTTAYRLAIKRGHLVQMPVIRHLSEKGNARQGFFTEQEFQRVHAQLPEDLKDFAAYGYITGSRSGEIKSLTWDMVHGDEIHIPGNITKNRDARTIPLEGQLAEVIARRKAARQVEVNGVVEMPRFIFYRLVHGRVVPVGDFKKSWRTACEKAGVNRIFHDFRRSAVRNMVQAGVNPQVAKKLSGHKSDSMFSRYSIIVTDDLREAQNRTEAYRKNQQQKVIAMTGR